MNHNPYSHSKISCYEECPYKFKARYLDKLKIAADPKHFEKGNYYHWILEHYPNVPPDAPFVWKFNGPEKQKEFEVYIRTFLKNPRTQYLLRNCKSLREYEFQVHGDLEKQIAEKANKWISLCWGYIDLMAIDLKEPKNLILIDWKSQSQSYIKLTGPQLAMYAFWGFLFTDAETITVEYGYVQNNQYDQLVYYRDEDYDILRKGVINRIEQVESDSEFKRKVTKKCKWCDYANACNPFANMGK